MFIREKEEEERIHTREKTHKNFGEIITSKARITQITSITSITHHRGDYLSTCALFHRRGEPFHRLRGANKKSPERGLENCVYSQ